MISKQNMTRRRDTEYCLEEIIAVMSQHSPKTNPNKIRSIATEYYLENTEGIMHHWLKDMYDVKLKHRNLDYQFAVENFKTDFDYRYNHNGKKLRWADFLMARFPYFQQIARGRKGKYTTKVTPYLTQAEQTFMIQSLGNRDMGLTYCASTGNSDVRVPIDVDSLNNYIQTTQLNASNSTDENYSALLDNYVAYAYKILGHIDNDNIMWHIPSSTDWPREYYTGFSLQNVPSVVREAALGKCVKYDLNASVFSVYTYLLLQHLITLKKADPDVYPNLDPSKAVLQSRCHEYSKNKNRIRTQLAKECLTNTNATLESKEKYIKNAITALGFGASRTKSAGYYNEKGEWVNAAMNNIIKSNQDRQTFFDHPFVVALQQELETLVEYAVKHIYPECKDTLPSTLYSPNGRLRKYKFLNYVYCNAECSMMNVLYHTITKESKYQVLLKVHDGFYLNKTFPVRELHGELIAINQYASIDKEDIDAYAPPNYSETEDKIREQQHRIHIAQEEQLAQQYAEKRYGD